MADPSAAYRWYVGVDIAADTCTAAWLTPAGTPTASFTADQTPADSMVLRRRLRATAIPPAATVVVLHEAG